MAFPGADDAIAARPWIAHPRKENICGRRDTMAVMLVMQFEGPGQDAYDEVMRHLGLSTPAIGDMEDDWPEALVSHTAGATANGWCVVDVWRSQDDFDAFFQSRLEPAMRKVSLEPPQVTAAQVYKRYPDS